MQKLLLIFLLSIVCMGSAYCSAIKEDNDGNKPPAKPLLRDPWDCYDEDRAEEEQNKLYDRVWERAKEVKRSIRSLEHELKIEQKKPGEFPPEHPGDASYTVRYYQIMEELDDLREEQRETNEHFGGVNPPISDDEDDGIQIDEPQLDFSLIDMKKELKDYQKIINTNTWQGGDPSSSDED